MLQIDETLWCHIWLNFRNFLTFWYTTGRLTSSTSLEVLTATKPAYITMFWNASCTNWNICYFFSKICIMIVSHWWWLRCFGTCLFVKSNVLDSPAALSWKIPISRSSDQIRWRFLWVVRIPLPQPHPTLHTWKPPLSKGEAKTTSKINLPSSQTKTEYWDRTYVMFSTAAVLLALTCIHSI